jgi:hypothetical protein
MSPKVFYIFILLSLMGSNVYAQKLSLGLGAYSINASVGDNETTVSNLGAYRIQFHSKVQENFEFLLGYNILIEKIYNGDKAFGPFVGFSYFPFGSTTASQSTLSNLSILSIKQLNPYFYTGFNQRQYQSVKATYSGFSFGAGAEMGWSKEIAFFADIQYAILDGPNEGEASEFMSIAGIMYQY